jgi:hypothetical protein
MDRNVGESQSLLRFLSCLSSWLRAIQVTHADNGCRHFAGGVVRGYPESNDPFSKWVHTLYGGKRGTRAASNIVFSNGLLECAHGCRD